MLQTKQLKSINNIRSVLFCVLILMISSCAYKGKNLFILSGQSNMALLNPAESFIPRLEVEYGKEKIMVVKDAKGGQPIRRWYQNWNQLEGDLPKAQADLYDSLMKKVYISIADEKIATVTFIWMQGERDAREKFGEVYEESLTGIYKQLCEDLNRKDINFIIGRLSDFGMTNTKYPHWELVRDVQVKVAESNPMFGWVDTDDLNDGINNKGKIIKDDLHMSVEGYKVMGQRFAELSIQLIKNN